MEISPLLRRISPAVWILPAAALILVAWAAQALVAEIGNATTVSDWVAGYTAADWWLGVGTAAILSLATAAVMLLPAMRQRRRDYPNGVPALAALVILTTGFAGFAAAGIADEFVRDHRMVVYRPAFDDVSSVRAAAIFPGDETPVVIITATAAAALAAAGAVYAASRGTGRRAVVVAIFVAASIVASGLAATGSSWITKSTHSATVYKTAHSYVKNKPPVIGAPDYFAGIAALFDFAIHLIAAIAVIIGGIAAGFAGRKNGAPPVIAGFIASVLAVVLAWVVHSIAASSGPYPYFGAPPGATAIVIHYAFIFIGIPVLVSGVPALLAVTADAFGHKVNAALQR